MKAINWKSIVFLALVFGLFATIQGCPMPTSVLVEGETYEAELQINADSSLYALEIEQEGDDDGDDEDDDECEQEGEHEGECDDEDDDEDEDECEQEGEHEGENEGCEGEFDMEGEISALVISIGSDRLSFELLPGYFVILADDEGEIDRGEGDDDDHLTIADLEVGMWVEVEGEYENGMFEAEEIELADENEIEIEGVAYNITPTTFSMLGLTISYDDTTEIEIEDDDDDHDDDDDDDDDDDEHED